MQTPTVGRIVNFYPERHAADPPGVGVPSSVPRAAIIIDVHSESCVSLQVFGRVGDHLAEAQQLTSVLREDTLTEGDDGYRPPCWQWPTIVIHKPGKEE